MKTELNYLFDVDGTLTPSRGVIDDDFKKWLINFALKHNVVLVTGSDRPKTIEQLGTHYTTDVDVFIIVVAMMSTRKILR